MPPLVDLAAAPQSRPAGCADLQSPLGESSLAGARHGFNRQASNRASMPLGLGQPPRGSSVRNQDSQTFARDIVRLASTLDLCLADHRRARLLRVRALGHVQQGFGGTFLAA